MSRALALLLALLLPVSGSAQAIRTAAGAAANATGAPAVTLPGSIGFEGSALPAGPDAFLGGLRTGLGETAALGSLGSDPLGSLSAALQNVQTSPMGATGLGSHGATGSLGQLGQGLETANISGVSLSDGLGQAFDGQAIRGDVAFADNLPSLGAAGERATDLPDNLQERGDDVLELRFLSAHSKSLFKSERTGTVRLVKESKGSKKYWAKFKKGAEVAVVSGGSVIMRSKVLEGRTVAIRKLTKLDLKGVFTEKELALLPIARLRQAIIENLSGFNSSSIEAPVSLDSKVRLIRFESYAQAAVKTAPPAPDGIKKRAPLKLAEDSPLHQLYQTMPKAVLLDLDMFSGAVPAETLSDMAKLQRTGVTFVAVSRRPFEGPDGVKDVLFKNMTGYQRDVLLPYRFLGVFEGGSDIVGFERGGRTRPISSVKFADHEVEAVSNAALRAMLEAGGSPKELKAEAKGGVVELAVPEASVDAVQATLERTLKTTGLDVSLERVPRVARKKAYLRVSKSRLSDSVPQIHAALAHAHGVYADGSEVLLLTRDKALQAALAGTPDVDALTGGALTGEELAENALGAALAEHREDREGDVAGSASRMGSFLSHHNDYLDRYVLMQEDAMRSIHFFSGHMVHKALDWAVHQLKHGAAPTEDEVKEKLRHFWEAEDRENQKPIGLAPGHTVDGMLDASMVRAANMYRHVVELTAQGFQMLGTEIPNFFTLYSHDKDGSVRRRYTIHTIFDLVAIKPDGKGSAEVVILDFKSGPPQTNQKLAQDLQVLTYSLFLRYKWKEMSAPYTVIGGERLKVSSSRVEFLYSPVRLSPHVNLWDLEKIERKIIRTLDRMQKEQEKNIPTRRKKPKQRGGR